MRKILLTLVVITLLAASAFCQTITGSQIPNETAAELFAYSLTQSPDIVINTLTYGVGLTAADVTVVENGLQNFNTQYQSAISTYSAAVDSAQNGADITAAFNSYVSARATITNNFLAAAQAQLTPAGYAALTAYVQEMKGSMVLSNTYNIIPPHCQSQNLGLATVDNHTLNTDGSVTTTVTVSGVPNPMCPYDTATGTSTASVNGVGSSTNTASGPDTKFMSVTAKFQVFKLENNCYDYELDLCGDDSAGSGTDTIGGGYYFIFNLWFEIAWTMTQYTGAPGTHCAPQGGVTFCDFAQNNWCTAATTPPDFNMNGQNIWWAQSDIQGYYLVSSVCVTATVVMGHPTGPWFCSYGLAQGAGNTQPKYSCSKH